MRSCSEVLTNMAIIIHFNSEVSAGGTSSCLFQLSVLVKVQVLKNSLFVKLNLNAKVFFNNMLSVSVHLKKPMEKQ